MNERLERKAIERVAEILKGETFYYQDVECCVISDAEECYSVGYLDALNNVCAWLEDNYPYWFDMKEQFTKAMKGGDE